MRLANGLEIVYDSKESKATITKVINSKLHRVTMKCQSCKLMFILLEGYSSYSDDNFVSEAKTLARLL